MILNNETMAPMIESVCDKSCEKAWVVIYWLALPNISVQSYQPSRSFTTRNIFKNFSAFFTCDSLTAAVLRKISGRRRFGRREKVPTLSI